jgi:hypothetical protein
MWVLREKNLENRAPCRRTPVGLRASAALESAYLMGFMVPQSKLSTGKFSKEIKDFFVSSQKSHDKKSTLAEQYFQPFNAHKRHEKTKRQSCRIAIESLHGQRPCLGL